MIDSGLIELNCVHFLSNLSMGGSKIFFFLFSQRSALLKAHSFQNGANGKQ